MQTLCSMYKPMEVLFVTLGSPAADCTSRLYRSDTEMHVVALLRTSAKRNTKGVAASNESSQMVNVGMRPEVGRSRRVLTGANVRTSPG